MTNPLEKHIADSLEKEKIEILNILAYQKAITDQGISYTGEKDWALNNILKLREQSLLQLLEIARGEVEYKLKDSAPANYSEDDYNAGVQEGLSQALDTLTITEK